jgi:hypothetical protein
MDSSLHHLHTSLYTLETQFIGGKMLLTQEESDEQAVRAYNSGYIDGTYDSHINTIQQCIDVIERSSQDYVMVGSMSVNARNTMLRDLKQLMREAE